MVYQPRQNSSHLMGRRKPRFPLERMVASWTSCCACLPWAYSYQAPHQLTAAIVSHQHLRHCLKSLPLLRESPSSFVFAGHAVSQFLARRLRLSSRPSVASAPSERMTRLSFRMCPSFSTDCAFQTLLVFLTTCLASPAMSTELCCSLMIFRPLPR